MTIAAVEQSQRRGAVEGRLDRLLFALEPDQLLRIWNAMCYIIALRYGPTVRVIWSCEQRMWQYVILGEVY
jgi:hypothetical protein